MLVVDAGALAVALADDGADGDRARTLLIGHLLVATSVLTVEVLGVWRQAVRTGALSPDRARTARRDLTDLPVCLVEAGPALERCWQLQDEVHAHDAAALALAELIEAPLVTTNPRLVDIPGTRARVILLH
jgi:predicted nucleic acid-binding protein